MDIVSDELSEFLYHRMNVKQNNQWGNSYRALIEQIRKESPDFSDNTIRELWYMVLLA